MHGDLRARTRFARDRHDLDDVVLDLRHLELDQALHEAFGRAREHDERPFVRLAHVEHVGADAIVDAEVFARHLFGERQQRFVLVVEQHVHVALFVALDRAHHDVVQLRGIRVVHGVALGFADALHDDLLRGLRGDAAEIFRRDFLIVEVARLRTSNPLPLWRSRASDLRGSPSTTLRR